MKKSVAACAALLVALMAGDSGGARQVDEGRLNWHVQVPFAEPLVDRALTYRVYGQPSQFELTMSLGNESPTAVYFHDGRIRRGVDVGVGLLTDGSDDVDPVAVRVEWPGIVQGANYNPIQTLPDQQLLAEASQGVWWLIVISRADGAAFAPGTYRLEVALANVRAAVTTFDGEPWRGLIPPGQGGVTKGHLDVIVQEPEAPREFADMYWWQGVAARERERVQDALEAFSLAVDADPTYDKALWSLGETYNVLGRYSDALAVLRKVGPPLTGPVGRSLALAYVGSGDEGAAVSLLRSSGMSDATIERQLELLRENVRSRPAR